MKLGTGRSLYQWKKSERVMTCGGFAWANCPRTCSRWSPLGPSEITAAEIASKMHTKVQVDPTGFQKAIRRKLVDLQRDKIVRSVRLGGHQLGWHLVS